MAGRRAEAVQRSRHSRMAARPFSTPPETVRQAAFQDVGASPEADHGTMVQPWPLLTSQPPFRFQVGGAFLEGSRQIRCGLRKIRHLLSCS